MKPPRQIDAFWALEAIRLKENQWGPLEDTAEVRRAIAAGGSFVDRLSNRALGLAQRLGWAELQAQVKQALLLSLSLLSALFIVMGSVVALGALSSATGRINVLVALFAFLAVPTLSLLFWLLSFVLPSGSETTVGVGFSRLWLWCGQRLIKGPDQLLLWQALLHIAQRQQRLRWIFSAVHHWLWLLALGSATVTLLLLLAAKRYSFSWETTLLSPAVFVMVVEALGVLPGLFGFLTPDPELIRQSDGLQSLPAQAQVQWSSWLVGCVVVYGIMPRLLALVFSLVLVQRRNNTVIDSNLPGLIEHKDRLLPQVQSVGIDAIASEDKVALAPIQIQRPAVMDTTAVIGIELAPDQTWPPFVLPNAWTDAGLVDSREQRLHLLEQLNKQQYVHLVLCVQGSQTADRGVIAWLSELASYGRYSSIFIIGAAAPDLTDSIKERINAWQARLDQAGFQAVYLDFQPLLADLN